MNQEQMFIASLAIQAPKELDEVWYRGGPEPPVHEEPSQEGFSEEAKALIEEWHKDPCYDLETVTEDDVLRALLIAYQKEFIDFGDKHRKELSGWRVQRDLRAKVRYAKALLDEVARAENDISDLPVDTKEKMILELTEEGDPSAGIPSYKHHLIIDMEPSEFNRTVDKRTQERVAERIANEVVRLVKDSVTGRWIESGK